MTMTPKTEKYDVGIIVGRFQSPFLHEGHKKLIDTVIHNHDKVIIFLGISPVKYTTNNPLDYEMRYHMIKTAYHDVVIVPLTDEKTDEVWSANLDKEIKKYVSDTQSVVLYGGRDSFIKHYTGKNKTIEVEPDVIISATAIRKKSYIKARNSEDFRSGVIHATGNSYPTAFTTVDVAIIKREENKILLGRKENEKKYRFIGGFSSPNSESFEDDAKREVYEETGLEVSDLRYKFSMLVDDWRYRKEKNKIKTIFFEADYVFGRAEANDDIHELQWFNISCLSENDFEPEHAKLFKKWNDNRTSFINNK